MGYKFRTNLAESGALETNALRETGYAPSGAAGSQELCGKSPPLLVVFSPGRSRRDSSHRGNGGGLETQIQRSPFSAHMVCNAHNLPLPHQA